MFTLTHSGVEFDVGHICDNMIKIEDIARALSRACIRYNGHSAGMMTVAQHCVLMSQYMEEYGCSEDLCFVGLHHDDAEAYMGDLPKPIKMKIPQFIEMENFVWRAAIAPKFSLPSELPPLVKMWDWYMITVEKRDLWDRYGLGEGGSEWTLIDWEANGLPDPDNIDTIIPWTPEAAEFEFLKRHHELAVATLRA